MNAQSCCTNHALPPRPAHRAHRNTLTEQRPTRSTSLLSKTTTLLPHLWPRLFAGPSGIGIAPPHRLNENHFQATLPSLPDAAELLLVMP